jgi:hypothetical protein
MYLRSDYYTNDERWEITGGKGYARVNRCTGRGIQQPSLEVYADGVMRGYHALDDDWASSFRDCGRHWRHVRRAVRGPDLTAGAAESTLAIRTRPRYELVQSLKAQGKGIKPIKRETGLAKETVRRSYYAETIDELLAKVKDGRPSILDEHKPCLHQRWNAGCTNVIQLHAELKERGYKGSYGTIRDYVLPFREAGAAPPAVPGPPKARDLARWITADPGNLDDDEKQELAQARQRCPHLDALAGHATKFAKILTGRHGDRLDGWMAAVEADDQPDLHSFVRGIKRDYDAVLNGLTMTWSSGVVEGNVNRLKTLKRQTYGRAAFPLLRKRVLLVS